MAPYNDWVTLDFYDKLYADSPIETAVVEEVHKTAFTVPSVFAGIGGQELQIPHYSCRIKTQERNFDNVTWLSPYTNHNDGSGMYVVPRRGTKVLIVYAKGGQPYIIGWLSPIGEDGRYSGAREVMPDGSMIMRGDRGNKVLVASGGRVRIQSSPTCRRSYSPSFDTIRDFCRNFFLTTAGGQMTWTESRDGQRLTRFLIEAFEKADDQSEEVQGPGESVRTQYGSHIEDLLDPEFDTPPGKIFSFIVAKNTVIYIAKNGRIIIRNQQPETGTDPNKITINNDGEFELHNVKEVIIDTETGAINLQAGTGGETKLQMDPDGDVTMESTSLVRIVAPQVVIEGDGSVKVEAPQVNIDGDLITLGTGGVGVARLGDEVLSASAHGPILGNIIDGSFVVIAS
jgi:hypothetical protein